VQGIAVEEILEEAVDEVDRDEDDEALPPGRMDLGLPDRVRREQLQAEPEAGKSQEDGERKEGKGEFLLDGVGCAGFGSDTAPNLPGFCSNSSLYFQRKGATMKPFEP
jgi:hypothetical protein